MKKVLTVLFTTMCFRLVDSESTLRLNSVMRIGAIPKADNPACWHPQQDFEFSVILTFQNKFLQNS